MKILSFDLDGTLLKNNKTVSTRSKNTLLKCMEKGKTLVFNSARPPRMIYDVLPVEFHDEIIISSNGACISKGQDIIYKNFITINDTKNIIDYLEKIHPNAYFSVEFHEGGFTSWKDAEYSKKMFATQVDFNTFDIKDSSHFFIEIKSLSSEEVDDFIKFIPETCTTLILEDGAYAQIMAKGNNKLNGISKVLDNVSLSFNDIVAFGDDYNDKEIIKGAGIGVAMGNAEDYIKNLADSVTLTNEEDGVAHYIEKHIL